MHRSRINGILIDCNVDDIGAAADLFVQPLLGVVRPDLAPDLFGERGERQQVSSGILEVVGVAYR